MFGKYTSYETKEQNSLIVTTNEYEIGYIPEGFELIEYENHYLRFKDKNPGNRYIIINISNEDFGRLSMDSEYSSSQNIEINGIDAELCSFNGEYYIIWFDGYHFISINTNIDEIELLKIAKTIEKIQ